MASHSARTRRASSTCRRSTSLPSTTVTPLPARDRRLVRRDDLPGVQQLLRRRARKCDWPCRWSWDGSGSCRRSPARGPGGRRPRSRHRRRDRRGCRRAPQAHRRAPPAARCRAPAAAAAGRACRARADPWRDLRAHDERRDARARADAIASARRKPSGVSSMHQSANALRRAGVVEQRARRARPCRRFRPWAAARASSGILRGGDEIVARAIPCRAR